MFAAVRHPMAHVLTTLAVLLALVTLGFGHAAHAGHAFSQASLDPSARAFVEAGGSLSDACGEDHGQDLDLAACPVCQLVKAFDTPEAATQGVSVVLRAASVEWHPPATQSMPPRPHLGHSSRAPPAT
ncbi:MAG: hypothetical protein AAGL23_17095 [Pseudomonadota bacterium]